MDSSDLELRVTVTASVPGESKRVVEPRAGATFPRNARLLRHADFERVYKLGRRHFSASLTAFYLTRVEGAKAASGLRVGFTVSRALGGAVQRNRMKRRLREAVRLSRMPGGVDADVVINPKKSVLTVEFPKIVDEVRRAFEVIEGKLDRRSDSGEARSQSLRRVPAKRPNTTTGHERRV